MPFNPIPNGLQLCFDFTAVSQHWQFCLSLQKAGGPPSVADLQAVADYGVGWWTSNLKTRLSPSVALVFCTATDMTAQGAPSRSSAGSGVGTASGLSLPLNVALVVSLRTALRGRSYRGRVYVSGITTNAQLDLNNATVGFAGQLVSDFTQLFTGLSGLGFQTVVASGQHNKIGTTPKVVNAVTSVIVDQPFDSQRRRLTGRGN